ncbi:hypothetical protein BDW02DRAFT_605243 [Decorospora gaudefroyi]|uniref:Uncharacterized protein n=1 Tax=Decorospora gaudefroyi TaxID=184978 RepID=A0A6A5KA55_9PLEO|nr:hypothetical protein BDW02DRAFT_605243 [Decorospora gaudefroyi]
MHRHTLSETGGMPSTRSSRTPSFSSDKAPSLASSVTFQMPTTVRPAPAYIAASVASQTVTDHHNAQLRHDDDAEYEELQNAVFSEQALALLNAFLDHLLFAFLSSARSPSLTAIRPAITDVLKPRLAREAMEAADEELQGLLAGDDDGGDDDDELAAHDGRTTDKWDVEKVWKRTRLRIMVYTRLGELEDEDEERYVQQERGLSMDEDEDEEAGLVSWASAIFLTSVIEYVAEQLLLVAGSAAFARMATRMKKMAQQMEDKEECSIERLIIEEPDVEKIALNAALGRLWRTWRKRVRSPISPLSPGRGLRSASSYSNLHHRKASVDTFRSEHDPLPEHLPTETEIAANIPLPLGDNDVNEIEVPGLAPTYEDESDSSGMQTPIPRAQRPSSVLMLSSADTLERSHKERPTSMPLRPAPLFTMPANDAGEALQPSSDQTHHSEHSDTQTDDDDVSPLSDATEEQQGDLLEPDAAMVAFAAATGMGFRMSAVNSTDTQKPVTTDEPGMTNVNSNESEPKVLRSKRMSIERPGPPGIVRTFSTRSSSLKSPLHTPVATPKAATSVEGRSYLDDGPSDDEPEPHRAIGIAKTSDNAIRSASTTPVESPRDRGKGPGQGGYVEVPPRSFTPTSLSYRNTPSPDGKPVVPERSISRKEINRRSFSSNESGASPMPYESPTSAPRRSDAPRSASHGSSLPALHEVETNTAKPKEKSPSVHTASRSIHTLDSPKRSPTSSSRETPVYVPERRVQRVSTEDAMRSQSGPSDRSPSDNTSLKRGASTSSSIRRPLVSSGRDSGASHRSRNRSSRMSEEDREREFDHLVKGQETVKFTLTPQNMRDLDSPVEKKEIPRRPSTSSVTVYPRVNAEDSSFGTANLPNTTAPRAKGPSTAQHKPSPSRKVVTRPLARDPKIETESMRDFADFIRSTGPSPGQEKPVQPFVNIGLNRQKPTNISATSLGRKMSAAGNTNGGPVKSRVNMEPRSPAGLSTGNDDLIDFIRQGPPSANNGQPRIPRNVAPFRTTVDSDQFDDMLGDHGNVESAYGSTSSTLESKNSTQTINSRTGLIASPSVVQPAYSNTPQQLSGSMASNAEPKITRTRRRVKDPYAIDLSDEEEDEDEDEDQLTALPASSHPPAAGRQAPVQVPRQAPRQESLMDFLNGMEPPSTSKPQPFMLSEETIAAARARANASSPSSSVSTARNGNGNAAPFGSVSSTSVGSDAPPSYKPRLQARAPAVGDIRGSGSRTNTSDLADFLRNSGPPEPTVSNVGPARKEEEKKSRKFWRRGKTYGDLP